MKNNILKNNIDALIKRSGLEVNQVAKLLNVSRGHLFKMKSGAQDINTAQIKRLAEIFGCSPEDIISSDLTETFSKVPIIDSIPADGFKDKVTAPITGYLPHKAGSATLFATKIVTEEMNLLAPSGSMVVIDYSKNDPQKLDNKTVMAFVKDHGQVLRKFRHNPERLEAYSNKPHETIYLKGDEWHIIGRVVGVVTDLQDD